MNNKETFASLIESFESHHDLTTVFNDFLTLAIGLLGCNPLTRAKWDHSHYLRTFEKYHMDPLKSHFPKMLSSLTREMTERQLRNEDNDVLGEFYDLRLRNPRDKKLFIPYPDSKLMARSAIREAQMDFSGTTFHIVDFACGSGRVLVSASKERNNRDHYFGIDSNHTFVRMAALNLFLNGVFNSEVMCSSEKEQDDCNVIYIISSMPCGIFQIDEKEKSFIWNLLSKYKRVPDLFRVRKQNLN
ncbi:MAG: N-6 DNA methylase [Bacteroidetes bacterium]|nr:N-6 DNA methylase [Bacteroidota bacterium]